MHTVKAGFSNLPSSTDAMMKTFITAQSTATYYQPIKC